MIIRFVTLTIVYCQKGLALLWGINVDNVIAFMKRELKDALECTTVNDIARIGLNLRFKRRKTKLSGNGTSCPPSCAIG